MTQQPPKAIYNVTISLPFTLTHCFGCTLFVVQAGWVGHLCDADHARSVEKSGVQVMELKAGFAA